MPSRTNIVVLGGVEAHLVDIVAPEGRGTPRYALGMERGAQIPASAQTEIFYLPAVPAGMPLHDDDLQPVFRWLERICRDPGLTQVGSSAMLSALRIFAECNLAEICARQGCGPTVIVGPCLEAIGHDERRAVRAHLATLAAGGVDLVHLGPTPPVPMPGRAVAHRTLSPAILGLLEAAGLTVVDAIFAAPAEVADATGLSRRQAVALQLSMVQEAARYRTAVRPGVESPLDVRLAEQAAALRRSASSAAQRPPPAVPARTDSPSSMIMMASAGPSHPESFEMRQPRLGEAVALVPTFDVVTGIADLIPMEPRLADALQSAGRTTPQPGLLAAPSRRPGIVGRLLAEIRRWKAERR